MASSISSAGQPVRYFSRRLEVLDPPRRERRLQRELASATAVAKQERRDSERRAGPDRRQKDIRVPAEFDRRAGVDRRAGRDRRKRE